MTCPRCGSQAETPSPGNRWCPDCNLYFAGPDDESEPWWSSNTSEDLTAVIDTKALVRVRNHAEDLAELTPPKVPAVAHEMS